MRAAACMWGGGGGRVGFGVVWHIAYSFHICI
jgi:hypothetical protein